ncbi:MAG: hypothetical protein WCK89_10285 [bacterium]
MTRLLKSWRRGSCCALSRLFSVVACACFFPSGSRSEELLVKAPQVQPHYEGRLRLEYDYRAQGNETDSDFYGYFFGSASDLDDGRYDIYISGRSHGDLDGSSSTEGSYRSVDDASGVTENRLLQAYVDAHDRKGEVRLRLGRQYIEVADYVQIDGGQLMLFENRNIGGRIYGGVPVSYYSSVGGGFAGGLSLVGRPWTGNRSRFTYAEYCDDSEEGQNDQNYLIDVQQEVTEAVQSRTRLSVLNDAFRYATFDVICFPPNGDTDLRIGASRWGDFDANTRVYSPLYAQLGEQQPYTYLYAKMDYSLGPMWMLSPGVSAKKTDAGDADYSNRDYTDYELTVTFEPVKALSASLSLEYWDVSSGDGFLGLSGEVRYRHHKIWEVSLGSAYMDYTYNSYSDISYSVSDGQTVFHEDGTVTEESPYALSYFLRMKWNITRRLIARLQGDIEDDEAETDLSYRARGSVEVKL